MLTGFGGVKISRKEVEEAGRIDRKSFLLYECVSIFCVRQFALVSDISFSCGVSPKSSISGATSSGFWSLYWLRMVTLEVGRRDVRFPCSATSG